METVIAGSIRKKFGRGKAKLDSGKFLVSHFSSGESRQAMNSAPSSPDVRLISSADTITLRLAILRPNRPREAALFDGDDLPTTKHFGAFRSGELVGIASLFLAECPELPALKPAMQLRGMATKTEVRGQGFGRALVMACLAHAQQNAMRLLWCNARCEAVEFYRKLQFEIVGDQFAIPDVGPHFRMFRRIR